MRNKARSKTHSKEEHNAQTPTHKRIRNKTRSKTHSKEEHNAPTPTHERIEGTCMYINNRRQQFPHQKDFNTG
jgi:hypothetical protein